MIMKTQFNKFHNRHKSNDVILSLFNPPKILWLKKEGRAWAASFLTSRNPACKHQWSLPPLMEYTSPKKELCKIQQKIKYKPAIQHANISLSEASHLPWKALVTC